MVKNDDRARLTFDPIRDLVRHVIVSLQYLQIKIYMRNILGNSSWLTQIDGSNVRWTDLHLLRFDLDAVERQYFDNCPHTWAPHFTIKCCGHYNRLDRLR
jgi:hypothetical protein